MIPHKEHCVCCQSGQMFRSLPAACATTSNSPSGRPHLYLQNERVAMWLLLLYPDATDVPKTLSHVIMAGLASRISSGNPLASFKASMASQSPKNVVDWALRSNKKNWG